MGLILSNFNCLHCVISLALQLSPPAIYRASVGAQWNWARWGGAGSGSCATILCPLRSFSLHPTPSKSNNVGPCCTASFLPAFFLLLLLSCPASTFFFPPLAPFVPFSCNPCATS